MFIFFFFNFIFNFFLLIIFFFNKQCNFCKIFKTITGDTFHSILNRHRIEIACLRLKIAGEPVERIAAEVGFADAKSFCRVFKAQMGISPGAYRKQFEIQKQFD